MQRRTNHWLGGEQYTLKTINSFVAMFDFLGFKTLRNRCGTEGIYQLYMRNFLPHIQHATAIVQQNGQSEYVPDFGPQSIAYSIFYLRMVLHSITS